MYIKITSKNKNLASILFKNPETDKGLYLTTIRKGQAVGNCIDPYNYEILYSDSHNSYDVEQSNQLNTDSITSPALILNIISNLFAHLIKPFAEVSQTPIPWLKTTIGNVDNLETSIVVNYLKIDSNWYRNGVHLLSKYIKGLEFTEITKNNFILKVTGNVQECFNKLAIVAFFTMMTNQNSNYVDKSLVLKIAKIFNNLKIPYFVYYLFIKRTSKFGPEFFKVLNPILTRIYNYQNPDSLVSFTANDTHTDRIEFVKDSYINGLTSLNYGCGEFQHEKKLKKILTEKDTVISYDIVDYSKYFEVLKERVYFNWHYIHDLNQLNKGTKYQVIMSEVIEHNTPEKAAKEIQFLLDNFKIEQLVITTPNKDFNIHYEMDKKLRHEDHVIEFTESEFREFMKQFETDNNEIRFFNIGDSLGGVSTTQGAILTNNIPNG